MGYTFAQSLHTFTFALLINSTTSDRLVSCHENHENTGSQEVCLVANGMQ